MLQIEVLKFGGSALASAADLPRAVDETYRWLRHGRRVLAVVSVRAGVIDPLLAQAQQVPGAAASVTAAPSIVAGGLRSAALFTAALQRAGIAAQWVHPQEIALRVQGDGLDAHPVSVDVEPLQVRWSDSSVLVVPGFCGLDATGRITLLGRGGSDLTALLFAQRLGARCTLLKGVAGEPEGDPAVFGMPARRYLQMPWQVATAVTDALIQPRVLTYAAAHQQPFQVQGIGAQEGALVGGTALKWSPPATPVRALRVVLLGLGSVGRGVYERLLAQPREFELVAVVVRRPEWHAQHGVPPGVLTTLAEVALQANVDAVVECWGGVQPAGQLVTALLADGKRVVTASRATLSACTDTLPMPSATQPRRLWCSAAIGGAVPILETLAALRAPVVSLRAVFSGVSTVALQAMARELPPAAALADAQTRGLTRADLLHDVLGLDAAEALLLLVRAAFGVKLTLPVGAVSGLNAPLPPRSKGVLRLVARAGPRGPRLHARVQVERLESSDFLAGAEGAESRFELSLANGDVVCLRGQGAGREAATTAVMGDLLELRREWAASQRAAAADGVYP